jgi:hypothetical protein
MPLLCKAALIATMALAGLQQARFESGDFKGFTKSRSETIICRLSDPIGVRSVQGVITLKSTPLEGVLFEIRSGEHERIWAAKTNAQGHFKIRFISPGTYAFKATLDGFQSVVGTIIVSDKAGKKSVISIEMPLGV